MSLLSVNKLGKAYRTYRSEWQRFARWFGITIKPSEEHWVLKHVSFDIQPGEAIGIIGQNGAGKSTLLKMITGTLKPSEGKVQVNGRIAAILDVSHAAGIMGFTAEQIQQAMPDIDAFAEIGEYFDEPVRTYSSGMQMRVAFAVATAYRPEVLIVDEALSVGDTYFQHKSFKRIREFQEQGTTLLIVSHDRGAIQSLCNRAILLENGIVIKDDNPEEVFDFYNALIAEKENRTIELKELDNGRTQTNSGTGEARIQEIILQNSNGETVEYVEVGEPIELRIKIIVYQNLESLVLGYSIKDRLGQVIYGTNTWHTKQVIYNPEADTSYQFIIAFPANLGVGSYSVQVALVDRDTHLTANYDWRDIALIFNVVNTSKNHFIGCQWNEPKITITDQT